MSIYDKHGRVNYVVYDDKEKCLKLMNSGAPIELTAVSVSDVKKEISLLQQEVRNLGGQTFHKPCNKHIVIGVWGQSNAVGYDESDITAEDSSLDTNRILQISAVDSELKPLTYCAENCQNMNTVIPKGATNNGMPAKKQAGTKGIHLPLCNLILKEIPDNWGIIIVPAAYGGNPIANFRKGKSYHTTFINNMKKALDMSESNVFGGIIWCQGENNTSMGASYANDFKALVEETCDELKDYESRAVHGVIDKTSWFFYEFPDYYRTGGGSNSGKGQQLLDACAEYLGSTFVRIPTGHPVNTTKYTSGTMAAHYGHDFYRTTIAPLVFENMNSHKMFAVLERGKHVKAEPIPTPPQEQGLRTLTQSDVTLGYNSGSNLGEFSVSNGTLQISGGGGSASIMLPAGVTHFEGTFSQWNSALPSFIAILAKSDSVEEGLFIPKLNNYQKYIAGGSLVQNGTINGNYQTSYAGNKVGAKLVMDITGTTVKVTLDGTVMYEHDVSQNGLFDGATGRTPALGFGISWSNKGVAWEWTDCKIS